MALETLDSASALKSAGASPAVRIKDLRKSFHGGLVLGGIEFDVPMGRIVSIIGQSGGGKTTLMRCVNLLECPDDGSIAIGDETIFADGRVICRDLAKLRQRVGMVFQRFNLFPHLTAVENVVLAQMHAAAISEREAVERAVRLLTRVGLDPEVRRCRFDACADRHCRRRTRSTRRRNRTAARRTPGSGSDRRAAWLSSPDSLGAYLTYAPRPAVTDAERNCVSNIRAGGLDVEVGSSKIAWLVTTAFAVGVSGVQLKDESDSRGLHLSALGNSNP
jgi:hypothetical protein